MLTDRHVFSLTHSARLKLQRGNWLAALNIYNEILRWRPDHKETYAELARLYLEREDVENARQVLHKAVRIAPDDSEVNFIMGGIKYIDGDFEGALECYRKVEEKDGLDCNLAVNLALVCEVLGHLEEALRYMEFAASQGEPNWRSFEFIVDLYKSLGKLDAAIRAAQSAVRKFPEVAQAHLLLARLYKHARNQTGALKHYEAAGVRAAGSKEVLSEVADFYLSSDRYDEAVPLLEKLAKGEAQGGRFHTVLAYCYAAIGEQGKAERILSRGARKRPRNASIKSKKPVSQGWEEE